VIYSSKDNWAIGEDVRLLRSELSNAPITYKVFPSVFDISLPAIASASMRSIFFNERYLVILSGSLTRMLIKFPFKMFLLRRFATLGVRSISDMRHLESQKVRVMHTPYFIDQVVFNCTQDRRRISENLTIGSFQRDTTNKGKIKYEKSPDFLLESLGKILSESSICVVLTAYRRSWLLERLGRQKFSNIELHVRGEDHRPVSRKELSDMYRSIDVYFMLSRDEGGPHSILECLFTNTPVVCLNEGVAVDIFFGETNVVNNIHDIDLSLILDVLNSWPEIRERALSRYFLHVEKFKFLISQ